MSGKPTKKEFLERIPAHLKYRKNGDAVNLIWKGYLAALMEWGLLLPNDYHELNNMLNDAGNEELREIFLGIPEEDE